MKKETIVISQKINITYNNEVSRKLCIEAILKDTNWIAFTEGTIRKEKNQYQAFKTKDISLIN